MRTIYTLLYYAIAIRLPNQPLPGWRIANRLRTALARRLFASCGEQVRINRGAYFGTGARLSVGDRSWLGVDCRIDNDVTIGSDVLMGPEVVVMTAAHETQDPRVPVMHQGAKPPGPVHIGDGSWLGTRVTVLPGVTIGEGAIVGAGAVVTRDVEPYSIVGGVPAGVIGHRG